MKALILVDIQNDFCKGGSLEVPYANEIIDGVNNLQKEFDLIVTTQDYHPKEHKSFAKNNNKEVGDIIKLNGIDQFMWPEHCVIGDKGSEFHSDLDLSKVNKNFPKGVDKEVDSYSGFFDNDGLKETGLDGFLKDENVKEVFVVGLALDYCVKFTALDAVKLGYKTTVLLDYTKAVNINKDDDLKAIEELKEAGVIIKKDLKC